MSRQVVSVAVATLVVAVAAAVACGPAGEETNDSGTSVPGSADASTTADARPTYGTPDASPTTPPPGAPDAGPTTPPMPPAGATLGDACSCDADCPSDGSHAGMCVYGVCMTRASAACSAGGSTDECGAGSRCWGLQGVEGSICWPNCDSYSCGGTCDADGSCVPSTETDCSYACGTHCNCVPGDCGNGEQCVSGQCMPEANGDGPGSGPGPTCASLPPRDCTGSAAYCAELIQFSPRATSGYDDYAINGEAAATQYRSWLRRDHVMLLKHATALVACKAAEWTTGNGGPLGLGDMSESNGAIPGTAVNDPGHPTNTHTNGRDIDVGYYQVGQANNYLRPICRHTNSAGTEQYHCTAAPTTLDVWRTALFMGTLFDSPILRVIGVDGKAGPLLVSAINELCTTGWLATTACQNVSLAYEETDESRGWFRFHHHHAHISISPQSSLWQPDGHVMPCIGSGCAGKPFKLNAHLFQTR